MNNFHEKYKKKPAGFTNASVGRLVRAGKEEERRKANRAKNFSRHRHVLESPHQPATSSRITSDAAKRLQQWKIERELKKKIEQEQKKPIFKTGIVRHHFYSPTSNDRIKTKTVSYHTKCEKKVKNHQSPLKRITQVTQKRLEAKKAGIAVTPVGPANSNASATRSKSQRRRQRSARKDERRSFPPENHASESTTPLNEKKPPETYKNYKDQLESMSQAPLSKMAGPQDTQNPLSPQTTFDLDQEGAIRKPLSDKNCDEILISNVLVPDKIELIETIDLQTPLLPSDSPASPTFSPCVTMSRDNGSTGKKHHSKMARSHPPPKENPTKATIVQSLNMSIENKERTGQYFKLMLQREIDRLTEFCDKWEGIKIEPDLTEDSQYMINQAIGQTNLLIRKKFTRFRTLVSDCETGKGEKLVQCSDLQGFWDLINMEVKDCESRFLKLDVLRSKNWIEEEIDGASLKKMTKKKIVPKPKIQAKSSARSWILARKKKMSQDNDLSDVIPKKDHALSQHSMTESTKTSEQQISCHSSEKSHESARNSRTTPKQTFKKTPTSLIKKFQLMEVSKNIGSGFTLMEIRKVCKIPEVPLDETISCVNSNQTPGQGILKKSEKSVGSSNSMIPKSARKVDSNDAVVSNKAPIIQNMNLQNSMDLGCALPPNDNYQFDTANDLFDKSKDCIENVTIGRVEKKLDFEDKSFIKAEETCTVKLATAATSPEIPTRRIIRLSVPITLKKAKENKCTSRSGGKSVKRSAKSLIDKSSLNLNMKENNYPQRRRKSVAELKTSEIIDAKCENEDFNKIRKRKKKSVRFNAEDSSDCADPGNPVHTMTPCTRRTRSLSLLGEKSRNSVTPLTNEESMSVDLPTAVQTRIRRTSKMMRKSP